MLEFALAPFEAGPVQQAVGVEGVPDALALTEGEADRRAALAQRLAALRELCRAHAVFLGQVLLRVFALGRHRRVQLEGLEVQLDLVGQAGARQRHLERVQAHGAPGAGHVGHKVDLHPITSQTQCAAC